jgi:hypothetical protein
LREMVGGGAGGAASGGGRSIGAAGGGAGAGVESWKPLPGTNAKAPALSLLIVRVCDRSAKEGHEHGGSYQVCPALT